MSVVWIWPEWEWSMIIRSKKNKTTYNWEWFEKCQSICKSWPLSFIHLLSLPISYNSACPFCITVVNTCNFGSWWHSKQNSAMASWFGLHQEFWSYPSLLPEILPSTGKVLRCSSYAQTVWRQFGTGGLERGSLLH